eukprot:CAMPEP_0178388510 /NCGR_PEP_ID=MMETSP0689_2-20121128/9633_1 /TAXON_ID=160604 /ORGANISM="Amphidinium massartii, Strain CS-259" /LENGTH=196 /DNA_ID=CAMNT_0020008921 /DNA_START=174 /DNA_END=764 /DNA_ORIENTATION=+
MPQFIQAMEEYMELLSRLLTRLGSPVGVIMKDVGHNVATTKAAAEKLPAETSTLRAFLQAEVASGIHKVGSKDCKLAQGSPAVSLEWLLRGVEFVLRMIQLAFEGSPHPARLAYEETLGPYHSFWASTGAKVLLSCMPSRKDICGMKQMLLEPNQQVQLEDVISREAKELANVALPVVRRMVVLFKEAQLWECSKV